MPLLSIDRKLRLGKSPESNICSTDWLPSMAWIWLVPKLRLGNPYLASSCLAVLREAGASKATFPSRSLGTSKLHIVPEENAQVGFTPQSPIFNVRMAFFVENQDMIIDGVDLVIRHQNGESRFFRWAGLGDTFSEITDSLGNKEQINWSGSNANRSKGEYTDIPRKISSISGTSIP